MIRTSTGILSLVAATLFLGSVKLHAQSVYEGFSDYANSAEILNSLGGDGFSDIWQPRNELLSGGSGVPSPNSVQLLPTSLVYVDAENSQLQTSGGSLFLTGEFGSAHIARTYDLNSIPYPNDPGASPNTDPPTGAITYVSFLARRSGEAADPNDPVYGGNYPWGDNLYPRVAGVTLWSNDNGDAVPLHIGNLSNTDEDFWRLSGQDLDDDPPIIQEPFGEGANTYFVVFKVVHAIGDGGGDQINMYLSPLLESESLNTPDLVENWEKDDDPLFLPGHWLSVQVGGASGNRPFSDFTFDEFRIGSTWEDVTPSVTVPEPSVLSFVLSALGLSCFARRRSCEC